MNTTSKKPKSKASVVTTISVPAEVHEQIARYAASTKLSKSAAIVLGMRELLTRGVRSELADKRLCPKCGGKRPLAVEAIKRIEGGIFDLTAILQKFLFEFQKTEARLRRERDEAIARAGGQSGRQEPWQENPVKPKTQRAGS